MPNFHVALKLEKMFCDSLGSFCCFCPVPWEKFSFMGNCLFLKSVSWYKISKCVSYLEQVYKGGGKGGVIMGKGERSNSPFDFAFSSSDVVCSSLTYNQRA